MSLNFTETLASLNEAKAKYDALVEEAVDPLKQSLVNIINENEDLLAFGWTQYTPYFNDGEACVFNVNELYYVPAHLIGEGDGQYETVEDALDDYWELPSVWGGWNGAFGEGEDKAPEALIELAKFLSQNEDVAERAFGDGVRILVTGDGVEVDEYDHD